MKYRCFVLQESASGRNTAGLFWLQVVDLVEGLDDEDNDLQFQQAIAMSLGQEHDQAYAAALAEVSSLSLGGIMS